MDNYSAIFESRISAGGTEKLPYSENLRISSWSYDMEGYAEKCVERYREMANKTARNLKEQFCALAASHVGVDWGARKPR